MVDKDHFPTKKNFHKTISLFYSEETPTPSKMKNNNNNDNNDNNNEEIEIINVRREGISFRELKELHSLSMVTLSNISRVLPTTPKTSITSQTIYSSKDVKVSKTNNNYLIPFYPFKEPCLICKYFGHGLKNCPNIKNEFRNGNHCLNCWEVGHLSGECSGETKVPPYNEQFLSPEEIINRLFYN